MVGASFLGPLRKFSAFPNDDVLLSSSWKPGYTHRTSPAANTNLPFVSSAVTLIAILFFLSSSFLTPFISQSRSPVVLRGVVESFVFLYLGSLLLVVFVLDSLFSACTALCSSALLPSSLVSLSCIFCISCISFRIFLIFCTSFCISFFICVISCIISSVF